MKALLLSAYKQLDCVEMPEPSYGPEDLLVRVKTCGICGSDVHGYDGRSGRRIPPVIMGHEAAGVVAQTGAQVTSFQVGDRVTFDSTVYCGRCFYCRRGEINLCDHRRVLGVSCGDYRQHGAFAEYVTVPQHIVYPLPDNLPFEPACMIEPVSIAVHAVNRTPIQLGDTAVVVGAGMIGLLVVQALRLAGCGRVFAVDLEDSKLQLARELGAEDGFNPRTTDVPATLKKLTGGQGVDGAIEAVGASASLQTAIACLRKGGTLTIVGNITPSVEIPLQQIVTRELNVLGSCASRGEYPACIALVAQGKIQVQPLLSACAPLNEGAAWFDRLYRQEPGLLKVVLKP